MDDTYSRQRASVARWEVDGELAPTKPCPLATPGPDPGGSEVLSASRRRDQRRTIRCVVFVRVGGPAGNVVVSV